ncbi:hypothetical protein [Xanthobacter wiegelii]|uniref:hypothetical protein n=1 Tax=Xanthobacter wiegelii TaxID=3119913 RepID=UPI0040409E72
MAHSHPLRRLVRGTSRRLHRLGLWLQAVQIGDGTLRMGGGREDRPLVVGKDAELSAAAHNVKERGCIA